MAIDPATDLKWRLSTQSGSAGNTTASTPAASTGKYLSTTAITDNSLNNIFDDISASENAGDVVDYRLIFLLNDHATLTLQSPALWIVSQVAGGGTVELSVDTTGVKAKGSATAQAKSIASETTAPTSQTFSAPTSGSPISLADIPAGNCIGIWIKRTAANTPALANDGFQLEVSGTTNP